MSKGWPGLKVNETDAPMGAGVAWHTVGTKKNMTGYEWNSSHLTTEKTHVLGT